MALQRFDQQDEFLGKHGRDSSDQVLTNSQAMTAPGAAIRRPYACLPQMGV
jgi:hypothetical protein